MTGHHVREFVGAFVLSAAGIGAAFAILWQLECRALDKALALGGVQ